MSYCPTADVPHSYSSTFRHKLARLVLMKKRLGLIELENEFAAVERKALKLLSLLDEPAALTTNEEMIAAEIWQLALAARSSGTTEMPPNLSIDSAAFGGEERRASHLWRDLSWAEEELRRAQGNVTDARANETVMTGRCREGSSARAHVAGQLRCEQHKRDQELQGLLAVLGQDAENAALHVEGRQSLSVKEEPLREERILLPASSCDTSNARQGTTASLSFDDSKTMTTARSSRVVVTPQLDEKQCRPSVEMRSRHLIEIEVTAVKKSHVTPWRGGVSPQRFRSMSPQRFTQGCAGSGPNTLSACFSARQPGPVPTFQPLLMQSARAAIMRQPYP